MSGSLPSRPRDRIRWGILGCGDVTEQKSGPGFQRARDSELVAVMRRQGALAADYARRHGVPRWYDEARALVADPDVDAVYVATPPGAHLDGVDLAAAAGKPVYVEKPMARNTAECDRMIARCRDAGVPLFVAYYRRALPRFERIRSLVADGAIGRLTGVSYRQSFPLPANADPARGAWRLDPADSGGGLLLDVGAHVLDLIDFITGPIPLETVQGHAAQRGGVGRVEDTVGALFRTADGTPGTAHWDFVTSVREDRLEFTGTAGRVSAAVFNSEPVRLETAGRTEEFAFEPPAAIAQPLIQTVVDALLGRGPCPSTGESARRTSAVMDRLLDGYYGGRQDAFWLRPGTWPGPGATP